jgi:hypothetical protein
LRINISERTVSKFEQPLSVETEIKNTGPQDGKPARYQLAMIKDGFLVKSGFWPPIALFSSIQF